jgi:hypothetical protein
MSKRRAIWFGAVVVLALTAGAAVWLLRPPPPGTVVIEVWGPAGMKFKGSCDVDGTHRDLSGAVPDNPVPRPPGTRPRGADPARFTIEGNTIVFSFTPVEGIDAPDQFSVETRLVGGRESYAGENTYPPRGVRGWVRFDRFSRTGSIESFDPANPEQWRLPPP